MDGNRLRPGLTTSLIAHCTLAVAGGVFAQTPESVSVVLPESAPFVLPVDADRGFPAIRVSSLEPMGWTGTGVPEEGEFVLAHRTGLEIRFSPGSPFLAWEGEGIHMAYAPYWSGDQFYVPLQLAVDLFPGLLPNAYRFDQSRLLLLAEGASDSLGLDPASQSGPMLTSDAQLSAVEPPSGGDAPAEVPDDALSVAGLSQENPSPPPWSGDAGPAREMVVIIDPGHGGSDPGATGPTGVDEKDVALSLGLALARELATNPEIEVRLTRDRDTEVPIGTRGEWATEWGRGRRAVFISIHANALPDQSGVRGFETYFFSEARTEHERRVAAAENAALPEGAGYARAGTDPLLTGILSDLRMAEYQQGSALLAERVQRALSEFHPGPDRGVKQGPFAVITNVLMPAILVEVGFITNEEEERLLARDEFHREAAEAMARALEEFLETEASGGAG